MRMTALEKALVNRRAKGEANARWVLRELDALGPTSIEHVLEVGCGLGTVAATLSRVRACDVIGVDLDPAQVALARSKQGETARLRFAVGSATALAFDSHHFDLVIAQNVFHHIPAWPTAVREIARVLRSGGHLIWNDLTLIEPLRALLRPFRHVAGIYTAGDVIAASHGAGLVSLTVRPAIGWLPLRHTAVFRKL